MNDLRLPSLKRRRKASDTASVTPTAASPIRTIDTVIIGAGFAGLGSAIRLRQAGVDDVVILERGTDIGGTWRDNQYPGAACDIPSHLYSYSFAMNPDWSRGYSPSAEILEYIHGLADQFDLRRLVRFGCNVTRLEFDEAGAFWKIATAGGETLHARTVVMAQGPLSNSSFPRMEGLDTFEGHKIHSARWDHGYDFTGKRVAVIGTGASAIQIVPELVKRAAHVKVFQRTPGWILPRPDYASSDAAKRLFRRYPATQSALREALYWVHESMAAGVVWTTPLTRAFEAVARAFLRSQVKDRWLRRQLTPDYRLGCKRILVSNDWYRALQAPNCQLITWPIVRVTQKGIRTVEGLEHQFDCIVFATGFDVSKTGAPFPVTGLGGRRIDDDWKRGAQAYKSVSVTGYPNLFLTFGPNSGPGHNSALVYMESQIDYIVKGVKRALTPGVRWLDIRADVQSRHNAGLQKRLKRTNWNSGCSSWYLTDDGFNATMFPGLATQFRRQMATFDPKDYAASPVTAASPSPAPAAPPVPG